MTMSPVECVTVGTFGIVWQHYNAEIQLICDSFNKNADETPKVVM